MAAGIPFTFTKSFQETMLSYMLKDIGFATKCTKYLEKELLFSESIQWIFEKIENNLDNRGSVPTFIELEDELKFIEVHKRKIYLKTLESVVEGKVTAPDFIKEKLTEYSRKVKFHTVFSEAETLYNLGKVEESYSRTLENMEDLYEVTFDAEGIVSGTDLEETRQIYIQQSLLTGGRCITTGIPELDKILGGGLEKKRVGVLLAEPKKGKTIGLIGFTCAAIRSRASNVVHFILEGTTEETTMKIQSRLSGIPYKRIVEDEITNAEQIKLDKIDVLCKKVKFVPMNTRWDYTILDIETRLKELERKGFKADLVVIDYGDLLTGRTKFGAKEKRHEQTEVFRDIKKMALSRNVAIWTASQAVRPKDAPEKEYLLRSKDISESYEKVRIVDFVATLNQTPNESRLGILRFHADIYRGGACDKTIRLITDFSRTVFYSSRYPKKLLVPSWKQKLGKRKT